MHEIVYKKLKEEGTLSWDKSKTFDEMWSHSTNVYLEKFLATRDLNFSGLKVLDLGTGTGTSALFAAKGGAEVTGVELSRSAISIAEKNAKTLGVAVQFLEGDVLDIDFKKKFDLVVDSTILHCIVGSSDRRKFFDTVKRHMKKDSLFFVNTMIASGDMGTKFSQEHFLFQEDVLWSLGINDIAERKVINGKSYFPHRTLLTLDNQLAEFEQNGFKLVEMEKVSDDTDGFDLVALLKI